MESAAISATETGLTRLMNSEAPVIVVLVLLLILLCLFAWQLYRKSEVIVNGRLTVLESDLTACKKSHKACELRTQRVAQAVIDALSGKNHEAKARAESVLEDSLAAADD